MKVRATQAGNFNGRRRPGDEFEVPEGTKGSWFVPASTPKPVPKKEPKAPQTLSEGAKQIGADLV